jgi:acylphosphatase
MATTSSSSCSNNTPITGFRFEVWGKVQGVFFRKYTQRQATTLGGGDGVVGWIRNTSRGTVEGEVACRDSTACQHLQEWLQRTGSPKSRIDRAEFQTLDSNRVAELFLQHAAFDVRKTKRQH